MKKVDKEKLTDEQRQKRNYKIRVRIVAIISVIAAIALFISYRGNFLEMQELGGDYLSVFWRNTIYSLVLFVINFLIIYFAFYFTNRKIKKTLKVFFDEEKKEMPSFPNKSISFVVALIGGIVVSKLLLPELLLACGNSWFGISNMIFKFDISFNIFWKPLLLFLDIYGIALIVLTLAYGIIYSIIILNRSFDGVDRETFSKARIIETLHIRVKIFAVLAALFVLIFMVGNIGNEIFMNVELSGDIYKIYGAGASDIAIKIAGYSILAVLVLFCILKMYKSIRNKDAGKTIRYVLIVPVYLIALALVLAIYQGIFIGSNDLEANEPSIKENIKNTRQAYGIYAEESNTNFTPELTESNFAHNANIINNVNLASNDSIIQDCQAMETSKGYYTFRQTQIEQYNIDGVEKIVYVSPREILNNKNTYSNKTYQYTHGYGAVITDAAKTDDAGNFEIVEDKFENLDKSKIKVTQPRIYYGLENNNAAVINADVDEFDYPIESKNIDAEYKYEGKAGLNLNFIDKFIIGIKEGNLQLAFSGLQNNDSKIILNRNIINRAKLVLPYIYYDEDPYLVVNDEGKLYWVIDGYTTSNEYPFSQKTTLKNNQQINYIRNSVKVIINAYDGEMKFYITDRNDPIVMAYNNVFPGLFVSAEESIPEDISKHFVYPKLLFNLQAEIIQEYHSTKTENLYRGKDAWEISETNTSGATKEMEPYYSMVNVNGKNELGLMLPYSTYGKSNLSALLVGTVNGGTPSLKICTIPSTNNAMGALQFETLINQDEKIASEIAALNTTGTRITKNTIIIPIDNSVLYVQTIYQQLINESTQRPSLKKVVVASGNKIAIGNNLDTAIKNLLSKQAIEVMVTDSEDVEQLINAIIKSNQNIKNSSQSGNWKLYGEDMQELTSLINKLETAMSAREKEKEQDTTTENATKETNVVNATK